MRIIRLVTMLILGGLSVGAYASDTTALPGDPSLQCQPVTVDGQAALSCTSETQGGGLFFEEQSPNAYYRCWRVCGYYGCRRHCRWW